MNNDLKLFSRITKHLISLTGYDEYGHQKSRGISTLEDLAEELNDEGFSTIQGKEWTKNSLTLFLFRLRKKYGAKYLLDYCNFDLIGKTCVENLIGEKIPHQYQSKANFSN